MQVYFIDNEEYFKRKATFYDEGTRFFEDNDQRAIFFCRGVIETVKKLGWAPDIIHCHGWLASFMPLYLRKFHYDDPMFADSKIVYSVYTDKDQEVPATLTDNLKFDGIDGEDLARYENASVESLNRAALSYSDGAVIASEGANTETKDFAFANVSNTIDISQDENPAVKVGELYEQIAVEESVA
ncbi:MAG TPA: glycogen synthase, partial [Cryomorphaceae bacterium]|nr:glycogen synthase [Cryomorphaceae bacterium]